MTRAIICVLVLLGLSACGGGNTATPNATPVNAVGASNTVTGDDGKQEPVKEDPGAFRKVTLPMPAGWHKLSKGEHKEFFTAKVLKDPGSGFPMLAAFADREAPHASSSTDADWKAWREEASLLLVFNVSKKKEDARELLKQHGAKFVEGFVSGEVHVDAGNAVYSHPDDPQKWMGGASNARGTYVIVALIRSEGPGNQIVQYPTEIKPE